MQHVDRDQFSRSGERLKKCAPIRFGSSCKMNTHMPHDFKASPAVSEKAVSTGPTQLTRVSRSASLEETVRICSVPTSCRPPTASISKNLGRLIFCQACGNNIEIPLNYSKLVVLCKSCHESTPARPPPTDKRFFRCDCGRLILVSVYVHSVNCPRPGCFRRLILPATTVINVNQVHSDYADLHRGGFGLHCTVCVVCSSMTAKRLK
ncbi:Phosphatidylinositol-4 5-bisphosphate 4-phosphatase [Fasciola gigantica]|uniref:Phosphatidylinositol-4,5-bisphosphate 4-phosphatase n=1 Tax=Fasciola gigantica TaxID=46835 RepID=A0A504YQD0_FASGI|nr:Phosphatidylinositol-4 5-bisphosphate 4-phosphatase [Fasciola gigantica]